MIRNQKGFTLIEIIAVLVILGILAAVAIPKYLDMASEARIKAAQGAIAEIKGRLSSSQAKYMMINGGTAPSATNLLSNAIAYYSTAANLVNLGTGEYTVTELVAANPISIIVTKVQTADCTDGTITPGSGRCTGSFTTASGI